MTVKLTDERIDELVAFKISGSNDIQSCEREEWQLMARELQERRKAEKEAVPVAMVCDGYSIRWISIGRTINADIKIGDKLYAVSQPVTNKQTE